MWNLNLFMQPRKENFNARVIIVLLIFFPLSDALPGKISNILDKSQGISFGIEALS